MSSWDASGLSETATWSQRQAGFRNEKMSDEEYRKRRESWNPLVGGEQTNPLLESDYEGMASEGTLEGFVRSNSRALSCFDRIKDHLQPEDDTIEQEYQLAETQLEKATAILGRVARKQKHPPEPEWAERPTRSRVRDKSFVGVLKQIYGFRCQVCGERISSPRLAVPGYVEGHHIHPLGEYDGPDILENVIIVCPNHHKLMEYGGMVLDLKALALSHHQIGQKFADFHNEEIAMV